MNCQCLTHLFSFENTHLYFFQSQTYTFYTYDTFIAEGLTIDMISCQEQLEIEFLDWCINIRFENYGIMLGMKGSKHIMLDKDLRMMTSQVQRLA